MKRKRRRVFVFGIDGGNWRVLDLLLKRGSLPNLLLFIKQAYRETLISSLPCYTIPAWVDFAVGAGPAVHGCYSFWKQGDLPDKALVIDGSDIKAKTFYEVLEADRLTCVLVNLPASFPFRLKRGFTVSSFLNPDDNQLFSPLTLREEIPELSRYRAFPDDLIDGDNKNKFLRRLEKVEENRWVIGKKLFKKSWDFFFYLFSATDWIQHHGLSLFTKKPRNSEIRIFKIMDKHLGWFLERLTEDDIVLTMSDHGFKVYKGIFYLNSWLLQQGYLKTKRQWYLKGNGFPKDRIEPLLRRGDLNPVLKLLAHSSLIFPPLLTVGSEIIRRFPNLFPKFFDRGWGDMGFKINPMGTKAFSRSDMLVHLRPHKKSNFNKLRNELIDKLRKLKVPDTNRPLFAGVYKSEEVWGKFDPSLPGIVLDFGDWIVQSQIFPTRTFAQKLKTWHDRKGIIIARGVEKFSNEVNLWDLAPSILGFFGIKPKAYMQGRTTIKAKKR